jgi:hypothetical protein
MIEAWKGYLIGSLAPKINIHLMAYKKKTDSLKMATVKNPTFTFDFTQIQGPFHQSLVQIGPVASEELINM